MNQDDAEHVLRPWMQRQARNAPDDLLLRVMAEVDATNQQSAGWRNVNGITAMGWITSAVAIAAVTTALALFVSRLPPAPAGNSGATPSAAATGVADRGLSDSYAESKLPDSLDGTQLHRWSLAGEGVGVAEWMLDLGNRVGGRPWSYAIAYSGTEPMNRSAGLFYHARTSGIEIQALTFVGDRPLGSLTEAFAASYQEEWTGSSCTTVEVSGLDVLWCEKDGWGTTYYAHANGATLYVVDGLYVGSTDPAANPSLAELLTTIFTGQP